MSIEKLLILKVEIFSKLRENNFGYYTLLNALYMENISKDEVVLGIICYILWQSIDLLLFVIL